MESFTADFHRDLQALVFTRLSLEYHLVSPFYSYILVTLGLCETHINKYFQILYKGFGTASLNTGSQAPGSTCFELLVALALEGPSQPAQIVLPRSEETPTCCLDDGPAKSSGVGHRQNHPPTRVLPDYCLTQGCIVHTSCCWNLATTLLALSSHRQNSYD